MIYKLETLESICEESRKFAHTYYAKYKRLEPMVVGYSTDNKKRVIVPYPTTGSDFECMQTQLVLRYNDVDKYAVIMESWMKMNLSEDEFKKYSHGDLAKDSDRVSAVTIIAVNSQGSKLEAYKIGEDHSLTHMELPEGVSFGGLAATLLEGTTLLTKEQKAQVKPLMDSPLFGVEEIRL